MKLNEIFSGSYLKADDILGKTVRVTISDVGMKEFDDGNKLILTFQGKNKSLVVNKTNANIIASNLGSDDTDNWIGHTIQLHTKKVEMQGKLVAAIRVVIDEAPAPAPKAKAPVADVDGGVAEQDDVPF